MTENSLKRIREFHTNLMIMSEKLTEVSETLAQLEVYEDLSDILESINRDIERFDMDKMLSKMNQYEKQKSVVDSSKLPGNQLVTDVQIDQLILRLDANKGDELPEVVPTTVPKPVLEGAGGETVVEDPSTPSGIESVDQLTALMERLDRLRNEE